VDVPKIVKETLREIGYTNPAYGIDADSCAVMNVIDEQSPEIARGERGTGEHRGVQGAGDQGMMFGFACDETPELMPLPIMLAHSLARQLAAVRKSGELDFLRPDGKSQVTVEYSDEGKPLRVDTVVIAAQHHPEVERGELKQEIIERVVKPICSEYIDERTRILINETGAFVQGGPHVDTGLTGRKIIVDTYGGMGRHGGGAFSGKVPNKQDRSGAYMARYIAKNIVGAGYAKKCEVQLSYAIGYPDPVSVFIDTFGTGKLDHHLLESAIRQCFDLSPAGIIHELDLIRPIYKATSCYGHFGREEFPWEQLNKVEGLRSKLG